MNSKVKKIINWTIVVLVILGLIALGYNQFQRSKISNAEYVTASVERGNLKQTVSATGTVKPLKEVKLNFKNTGKITTINVQKGDRVKENDVLAKQDDASLRITVQQAQANLSSAIAQLNQLKAGSTNETIEVSQKNVDSAQTAYDNAVKKLESLRKKTAEDIKTYEKAVNSSETALRDKKVTLNDTKNKYSQEIKNLTNSATTTINGDVFTAESALDLVHKALTNNDTFTIQQITSYVSQKNNTYATFAKNNNDKSLEMLQTLKQDVEDLKNEINPDINSAINSTINTLTQIKQTLSYAYNALQNTVITTNYSQTNINNNKTGIETTQTTVESAISTLQTTQQNLIDANINYDNQTNNAQANVNTAQDNLTTAKANLSAAEANRDLQISNAEAAIDTTLAALNLTKSQLSQTKAPPRRVDLASQEAQVEQYRAALALTQENLENTILRSSIDGIITQVNYELGEQSSVAEPVIVLVVGNNYAIEVDISEADIVKIENEDKVDITFDAFGEDIAFTGKVIFIDPAQTIISEVVYYTIKIVIEQESNENYNKIKPGMTANIDIMTDFRENILMIPQRAILQKNGTKYTRILETREGEQSVKEINIKTGITGDNGMVEISEGLEEKQNVVTFVKNGK